MREWNDVVYENTAMPFHSNSAVRQTKMNDEFECMRFDAREIKETNDYEIGGSGCAEQYSV